MRRKIFLPQTIICLLFLCLSCNSSEEVKVKTGNIEEALSESSQSEKNLVAIITYPGCPPCDMLISAATKENELRETLSHFIIYDFNAINPSNTWFEQWLFEKAYPITCVF